MTDPAVGQVVFSGTAVNLIVASGSNVLSDVSGQTLSAAVALVGKDGFAVATVSRPSPAVPAGAVIGTEPAAGSDVPVGTTVIVLVSNGPPTATPDPGVSPPPAPAPAPQPSPAITSSAPTA